MEFGASIFFTDYSITPAELAAGAGPACTGYFLIAIERVGLRHTQELFSIAGHMLLKHVTPEVVPDRPIEDHLGGVREMSLAVRIV